MSSSSMMLPVLTILIMGSSPNSPGQSIAQTVVLAGEARHYS